MLAPPNTANSVNNEGTTASKMNSLKVLAFAAETKDQMIDARVQLWLSKKELIQKPHRGTALPLALLSDQEVQSEERDGLVYPGEGGDQYFVPFEDTLDQITPRYIQDEYIKHRTFLNDSTYETFHEALRQLLDKHIQKYCFWNSSENQETPAGTLDAKVRLAAQYKMMDLVTTPAAPKKEKLAHKIGTCMLDRLGGPEFAWHGVTGAESLGQMVGKLDS
jgi:hypothetical protein